MASKRSSLRHAVFEACPDAREAVIEAVLDETAATEVVAEQTIDHLERTGAIYVAGGEVHETGAE
jgi:hypothetical protein